MLKKIFIGISTLASIGLLTLLGAPAAGAASLEGTDPLTTNCSKDATVISNLYRSVDSTGDPNVTIDLLYSASCGTKWVNIVLAKTGSFEGQPVEQYSATLRNAVPNPAASYTASIKVKGSVNTAQTISARNSCVDVSMWYENFAKGDGGKSIGNKHVC